MPDHHFCLCALLEELVLRWRRQHHYLAQRIRARELSYPIKLFWLQMVGQGGDV